MRAMWWPWARYVRMAAVVRQRWAQAARAELAIAIPSCNFLDETLVSVQGGCARLVMSPACCSAVKLTGTVKVSSPDASAVRRASNEAIDLTCRVSYMALLLDLPHLNITNKLRFGAIAAPRGPWPTAKLIEGHETSECNMEQ